ncbi:uncharacterized protein LOC111078450 [Drosophila obscura]|uniref:uncharacterized protein LOC111078450 n=1 Tax=Drosophila obscura TaxID=7282 RepID=UPI000B9FE572|nr:uncharacterized protein LOC111078450 [Drosophila obscura]
MMFRSEWLAYFQIVLIFSTLRHVDAIPVMEMIKLRLFQALSKAGFLVKVASMTGESMGETLINLSNVPVGLGMMVSALFASGTRTEEPPEDDPNCEKGGIPCKIMSIFGLKNNLE